MRAAGPSGLSFTGTMEGVTRGDPRTFTEAAVRVPDLSAGRSRGAGAAGPGHQAEESGRPGHCPPGWGLALESPRGRGLVSTPGGPAGGPVAVLRVSS